MHGKPLTREDRLEKMRQRWNEAERGLGGLRKVRAVDFYSYPAQRWPEILTGPTVLKAELEEVCVVMSLEDYFSMVPVSTRKPPLMRRIDGILYREVV